MVVRELINLIGFDVDESSFKRAENRVQGVISKMESFSQKATMFFTVPFTLAAGFMLKAASDANEMQNTFNQVFKGMEDDANAWAESYSNDLRRVDTKTKESLSIFQSMIVGFGATNAEAFELSKKIVTLGDDLSSFRNQDPTEVQRRFLAALSGSSEAVDQYGINLKVAALEQRALEKGITKSVRSMTELEKAILRLDIIEDTMTRQGAVGDAIRTLDDFANRLRSARDWVIKVAISFGNILLPVANKLLNVFISIAEFIENKLTREMKTLILIVGGLLVIIGPLTMAFTFLVKMGLWVVGVFKALGAVATGAGVGVGFLLGKFLLIGAAITAVIGLLVLLTEDIIQFVKGNESFIGRFIEPWATLAPKIKAAIQPFLILLSDLWNNIKSIGMSIIDFISGIFTDDIEKSINAITNIIEQTLDGFGNVLAIIIPILIKFVDIATRVIIERVIFNIPKILAGILKAAWAVIIGLSNFVTSQLNELLNTAIGMIGKIFNKVKTLGGLFGDDINANVTATPASIAATPQSIIDGISGSVTNNQTQSVNNVTNENTVTANMNFTLPEGGTAETVRTIASQARNAVRQVLQQEINDLAIQTGPTK